jgi:hypothetical protein
MGIKVSECQSVIVEVKLKGIRVSECQGRKWRKRGIENW